MGSYFTIDGYDDIRNYKIVLMIRIMTTIRSTQFSINVLGLWVLNFWWCSVYNDGEDTYIHCKIMMRMRAEECTINGLSQRVAKTFLGSELTHTYNLFDMQCKLRITNNDDLLAPAGASLYLTCYWFSIRINATAARAPFIIWPPDILISIKFYDEAFRTSSNCPNLLTCFELRLIPGGASCIPWTYQSCLKVWSSLNCTDDDSNCWQWDADQFPARPKSTMSMTTTIDVRHDAICICLLLIIWWQYQCILLTTRRWSIFLRGFWSAMLWSDYQNFVLWQHFLIPMFERSR